MATAFAQLPLKSLQNGEGPMKYPKIMIPNLRFFASERLIFLVVVSITHDRFELLYYRVLVYWAFHFFGSGLNHSWSIWTFHIIKFWSPEHFIFSVWVSITHDCIYHLITHIGIQRNKKYINCTPYILSHHGTNTNISIKYLLK